jgi:hypothetical protein
METSKAILKTVFKASLIITGASTFLLPWLATPFGNIPAIQVFGGLNIVIALGWDAYDNMQPFSKKAKAVKAKA